MTSITFASYRKAVVALLFVSLGVVAMGQNLLARSEVGLTGGGMNYLGDLNDQSMFGTVNLAGGLTARINLDTRWAVAFGGVYGHIEGGNPDVVWRRNLSFKSQIAEGFARVEFNFFPYGLHHGTQKRATPYIFCGVGFFKFNPQAQYVDSLSGMGTWYDLQPLGTEGQGTRAYPDRTKYQLFEVCMPFGIGYRWRISPSVHLTVEYGWRKTWTDYLDDVSTTYVDYELLAGNTEEMAGILADRSGEVRPGYRNPVGAQRGDDSLDDWYTFFGLNITVKLNFFSNLFGRHNKCEAY